MLDQLSSFSGGFEFTDDANLSIRVVQNSWVLIFFFFRLILFSLFESLGPHAFSLNPVPVKALQDPTEELKRLADKNAVDKAVPP